MALVYTNNAQSTLASALSGVTTVLTVAQGEGDRFPDISADDIDWFPLTLIRADGSDYEIVKAVSRDGDDITVERGEEDTPDPVAFLVGDAVSLRMTRAAYDQFLKNGDSTYLENINLAIQVNADNDPIELVHDLVSELFDGLRLTFKPVSENVGNVTVQVNELGAVPLRLPEKVRGELSSGDLSSDRFVDIRYVADDEHFELESPLKRHIHATETDSGAVELVEGDGVFDKEDDPVSISGAPKVATTKQVSQIVADFKSRIAIGYLPAAWTYRGDGSTGGGTSRTYFPADSKYHYSAMTSYASGTYASTLEALATEGVPVIRTQGAVTLGGVLQLNQNASRYPTSCVGPGSSVQTLVSDSPISHTDPVGEQPDHTPNQGSILDFSKRNINSSSLLAAILSGTAIDKFHGAQGFGHVSATSDAQYVPGRQGMVIVCEECEITSDAEIYMPTVSTREIQSFTTETYHVSVDQQHDNTCRGGGGLMIIVSESLTIADASLWQLDSRENSAISFNTLKLAESEDDFERLYLGAGQGQLFHINPMTGIVRRWL